MAAMENATVTVNGDVTGGDSMGTFGYGGDGVIAEDESTVTVNGNVTGGSVTADPTVQGEISLGGDAVCVESDATVTVNGNVTGGDTNGYGGIGGAGILLAAEETMAEPMAEGPMAEEPMDDSSEAPEATGSVTVDGTVSGGTGGENGTAGAAIVYDYALEKNADLGEKAFELAQTPVEELTEEEQSELIMFAYYFVNVTEQMEEIEAFAEEYFGGEIPENVTVEDQAAFAQVVITELVPEFLKESSPLLEEEYESVTVWELSDESGLVANSEYGALVAELYSADTTEYIIRVTQPKGGTITVDKATALEGETVTATVKVDEGYVLKSVSCGAGVPTDNGDGTYSFVVPAGGAVEVSAVVEAVPPAATPSTGDSFNMAFFAVLAVVSMMGICVLTFTRKKTA